MTPPKIEKYLGFNFYNFLKCWLVYEKIAISHFFGHFSNVISLANIVVVVVVGSRDHRLKPSPSTWTGLDFGLGLDNNW